jgi:hypothetical protein
MPSYPVVTQASTDSYLQSKDSLGLFRTCGLKRTITDRTTGFHFRIQHLSAPPGHLARRNAKHSDDWHGNEIITVDRRETYSRYGFEVYLNVLSNA